MSSRAFGPDELESALHARQVGIGADGSGVRPAAQQHVQGIHDDGFPRAGLAGEDDQPRPEVQVEVVDDGEVLDVQFGQHVH